MPFCNKCGYKLDPGDKFCFECGQPVRVIDHAPSVEPETSGDDKKVASPQHILESKQGEKPKHASDKIDVPVTTVEKTPFNKKPLVITFSILCGLLVFGAIFAICCSPSKNVIKSLGPQKFDFSPETQIGDIITLGSYELDGDESNGKEEIEWIVLDKEDNKALVISKIAIDDKQFNSTGGDVTWDTCTLRQWMNGEFFDESFNSKEQKRIVNTIVVADKHQRHISTYGTNTNDKVFLLSVAEVKQYFSKENDRKCQPAEYFRQCYVNFRNKNSYLITCPWWTRSPGFQHNYAVIVDANGEIESDGVAAGCNYPIRPAMWIDLGS